MSSHSNETVDLVKHWPSMAAIFVIMSHD